FPLPSQRGTPAVWRGIGGADWSASSRTLVVAVKAPNERLRRAREERNWTQAELARVIGTSGLTVSRWELGVQTPQPHFRERLCAVFSLSPRELGLIPDLPPVH